MREPAWNDHQVRRTVPDDLIGEVSFRASCVARLRLTDHRSKVSHLLWLATTFPELAHRAPGLTLVGWPRWESRPCPSNPSAAQVQPCHVNKCLLSAY
jgi:hypothetical protein